MSNEKRCDCCKRYWCVDDLVSGLCPNCLDFLATKNQMDIEQDQKIKKLEQQLAEKEKEIEKCNDEWRKICDGKLETINRLIEEKHELQHSQNQTAIAELEKVKERFNDRLDNFYLPLDHRQTLKEVFEQIDQQIKDLRSK